MSGPVRPLGGAALKHARRVSGITQEQLASRSNLSVRTVRGLESGSIRHPHQHSLLALAKALDLSPGETDDFISAWSKVQEAQTFTALIDAGHDVEQVLADNEIEPHDDYEDVSVVERHTVGPDRRSRLNHSLVAMRALNDGLDRRLVMWGRENSDQDLARIKLDGLHNCTAGEPLWLPKLDLVAFELDMGCVLDKDETHVFGYGWDFSDAYPGSVEADTEAPRLTTDATHGFRRALQMWVLQVDFECRPPRKLWQFTGPAHRRRVLRPLTVDTFGSAHLTMQGVAPGEYGIGWEW
ncbi:helix-turn-helix domain-containing protein [uncultured Jatrophihabitans sp.]|uniref:helix-turn-helix domain-containing protein n=1 Tax=uncultured Jatrophihabitans sp. TaxID=1610747 RepID=UPI0035CB0ECB